MLIALALAAAVQPATPPIGFNAVGPCANRIERARYPGVVYRGGDRPVQKRRLGELPDADMVLTVLRRDELGCPIIDVVQHGVSSPERPPILGVPLRRTPSLPQGRGQRQR